MDFIKLLNGHSENIWFKPHHGVEGIKLATIIIINYMWFFSSDSLSSMLDRPTSGPRSSPHTQPHVWPHRSLVGSRHAASRPAPICLAPGCYHLSFKRGRLSILNLFRLIHMRLFGFIQTEGIVGGFDSQLISQNLPQFPRIPCNSSVWGITEQVLKDILSSILFFSTIFIIFWVVHHGPKSIFIACGFKGTRTILIKNL